MNPTTNPHKYDLAALPAIKPGSKWRHWLTKKQVTVLEVNQHQAKVRNSRGKVGVLVRGRFGKADCYLPVSITTPARVKP